MTADEQPEGITYDEDRLPTLAGAARRVNDFLAFFGDGLVYAETGAPPLFARDLQALTNHVTGQGTRPSGSETEWGWRPADDDGGLHASRVVRGGFTEAYARERVAGIPGARVLVRREVGPWTEVQPTPGPGCYPPVDGWDGVSVLDDEKRQAATDRAHAFLGGPELTSDAELRALTPDQLEKCIHRALEARDIQAVEGYLLLMALKDPGRAQLLMDTLKAGLNLAKEQQP